MSDFKAKMHQIVSRLWLRPRPCVYNVYYVYLYILCNWPSPCYKIVPRPMTIAVLYFTPITGDGDSMACMSF